MRRIRQRRLDLRLRALLKRNTAKWERRLVRLLFCQARQSGHTVDKATKVAVDAALPIIALAGG